MRGIEKWKAQTFNYPHFGVGLVGYWWIVFCLKPGTYRGMKKHGEVDAMSKRRYVPSVDGRDGSAESRSDEWIDNEVVGCEFEDVRHGKRLRQLLEQLSGRVGATTPWACQDWANTKAAYRFFANDRISESNILAGHFACTRERFSASSGYPVLVLHDTTELSYRHEDKASIGILKKIPAGHPKKGRPGLYTSCGILMHSSLVATREGLPLGLAAIKFWTGTSSTARMR
jgi:hypothetical protein